MRITYILCICLLLLEFSCIDEKKKETINVEVEKTENELFSTNISNQNLDKFLENPIDLNEFKKIKKTCNSGGADELSFYYKPDTVGFYYHYFLFPPFKINIDIKGDTIRDPRNIDIVVFKKGTQITDFMVTNDILIELSAIANDPDLKDADLIGLDTTEIKDKFGEYLFKQDEFIIYSSGNYALIVKLFKNKIASFKYIKLNDKIDTIKIAKMLIEENATRF